MTPASDGPKKLPAAFPALFKANALSNRSRPTMSNTNVWLAGSPKALIPPASIANDMTCHIVIRFVVVRKPVKKASRANKNRTVERMRLGSDLSVMIPLIRDSGIASRAGAPFVIPTHRLLFVS